MARAVGDGERDDDVMLMIRDRESDRGNSLSVCMGISEDFLKFL